MEVVLKFKIQQPLYNPLKIEGVKKDMVSLNIKTTVNTYNI